MAHNRITRNQWHALLKIRLTGIKTPEFPRPPRPWAFHNTVWSSLDRRQFIRFTFPGNVCHVQLTDKGIDALERPRPSR